jgi:DNA-binding beta-propeller fold protein YncE
MLLMIDPRARKIVKEYDIKGKAPHLVKLANDRVWAYTSNTDTGTVSAVNLETGEVRVIPIGERPQGMAFSPENRRLYVTTRSRKHASARFQPARDPCGSGSLPTARRW